MSDEFITNIEGQAEVDGLGGWVNTTPSGKSVAESAGSQNPLKSALAAGLDVIDQNQVIEFVPYMKVVLPLDGFVFWVRAAILSDSALYGASAFNTFGANTPQTLASTVDSLFASGSLHISTSNQQGDAESFSINSMTFTSKVRINDLNEIGTDMMYIAKHGDYKFAFSQRSGFYKQADLYHYKGDAVYPVLEQQIIEFPEDIDTGALIVSNSLPIWLTLNSICPMYPSYLVADNIRPPYCAVDIPPEDTLALQAFPYIEQDGTHWQLVKDKVKLTFYGLNNSQALAFQDYMLDQSATNNLFGLMNMPVMRDEKRTQTEISAIAQKKSMTVEISYYQIVARNIARQLILTAIPTFVFAD